MAGDALCGLAVIGVLLGAAGFTWQARRREWREVADDHGLRYRSELRLFAHHLEGRIAGRAAHIHTAEDAHLQATVLQLDLPDLSVAPQNPGQSMMQVMTGISDVQLGDAELDAALLLRGRRSVLLALLSPDVRDAVVGHRITIEILDRTLTVAMPGCEPAQAHVVIGVLEEVLSGVAAGLHPTLMQRMADPSPPVRRAALGELLRGPPAVAQRAATTAIESRDAVLRIRAARFLEVGSEFLDIALDRQADAGARVEAVRALLEARLPASDAIVAVLATGTELALTGALDMVHHHQLVEHLPQVVALLGVTSSNPARCAALRVIGELGEPSDAHHAAAFVDQGTTRVRTAARDALSRLRGRHGLEEGGLSLVSAAGGELSEPTPGERGDLSLPSGARRGTTLQGE